MTINKTLLFLLFSLCNISFATAQDKFPIDWLCGTWQVEGQTTYEQWTCQDGKMLGKAYFKEGDQQKPLEEIEITYIQDHLFYIPVAYGQNDDRPVYFGLKERSKGMLHFENLKHDFPTRIIYKKVSDKRIEVEVANETRTLTILMDKKE